MKEQQHSLNYYANQLTGFGKFLWYIGVFEIYAIADNHGTKLNWWNPIAWLFIGVVLFIATLVWIVSPKGERLGFKEAWYQDRFKFAVNSYYRKYPERLVWIPRSKEKRDLDEFMNIMSN